jgi:PAS domain S-box-containing protein
MAGFSQANPGSFPLASGGRSIHDRLAYRCGMGVCCLGVLGLVGGLSGHLELGRVLTSSVPMALSTAVLFIITGGLLAQVPVLSEMPRWLGRVATCLAAGIVVTGLINVLEYVFDLGAFFDPLDWTAYLLQTSLGFTSIPMSPATGALFAVTGASLSILTLLPRLVPQAAPGKGISGVLGCVVSVAALTLLLGYVYGNPLLYGSGVVPVAFPTAAAFLVAGLGLVCAAGPEVLPLRPFSGGSSRARILRAFTPVVGFVTLAFPILSKLSMVAGIHDALATSLWTTGFAGAVLVLVVHIGRVIGSSLDTAECMRDQAEQSLRVSETRFRAAFEQAAVGMAHVDMEGRWIMVNRKLCDILGYGAEELKERTFQDITHPDDLEEDVKNYSRMKQGEFATFSMEKRYIHKDGSTVWASITVSMVRNEYGGAVYALAVIQDISERKGVEGKLEKAQSYIKNLIDSMPSTVIGVDPKGMVTLFNQAASRELTSPPEDAVGDTLEHVFPVYATQLDSISKAIRERKPILLEKQPRAENGEIHFQDVLIYPLVANGVDGAVLRIDDVTERVRLSEMMVQTEKMMSVGGLAAGMAHEINNPLGAIMQSAQVILLHMDPANEQNRKVAQECGCKVEDVREYLVKRKIPEFLEGIREAGARAARIVANMLNFSRRSDSSKELVSVEELLDNSVELASTDYDLKKKYDFRHVRIVREYDQDVPPVFCSRTEIEQVVLNLLKNAAQAMATKNYDVQEQKPTITLRIARDWDRVVITVEDNGPGMEEPVRKRVFEPFFTTKGTGQGTGLGLSVSYFIISTNHGGSISVESSPGEGTRFVIGLPAYKDEQEAGV